MQKILDQVEDDEVKVAGMTSPNPILTPITDYL